MKIAVPNAFRNNAIRHEVSAAILELEITIEINRVFGTVHNGVLGNAISPAATKTPASYSAVLAIGKPMVESPNRLPTICGKHSELSRLVVAGDCYGRKYYRSSFTVISPRSTDKESDYCQEE